MNTTFIVFFFLAIFIFLFGVVWSIADDSINNIGGPISFIFGFVASLILGIISLAANLGQPIVEDITNFNKIKGNNVVIIELPNTKTITFSDAESYNNFDKVNIVRKTIQRNAWGFENQSYYVLVFGGNK